MQSWRIVLDRDGTLSDPVSAETMVERLWQSGDVSPLVVPADGGEPLWAEELPEFRAILVRDPAKVASAWLGHCQQPDWLFGWVMDLSHDHPSDAQLIIKALVEAARSEKELALIGAGPLEDLLANHGEEVITWVEAEATSNPGFWRALRCVWRSSIANEIWEWLAPVLCTSGYESLIDRG
jgi:hypothetical protein